MFFCRVRLYINVPGSLIINTSSKQPKKPPLSSTKITPNTELKQQAIEQQHDQDNDKHQQDINKGNKQEKYPPPLKTTEQTDEHDEEEIDDASQPLLSRDALSETTKDSADTVVMVQRGNTPEPSTSGMNDQK